MTGHVVPQRLYVTVFLALIILTAITVGAALVDLGPLNTVVALAIAGGKAVLVFLFFMHVFYSPRLIWLVLLGSVYWLGIMIALTLSDVLTRGWLMFTAE